MPHVIRVFHCDDTPAFTRLVRHWLSDHEDLEYAGAAHTGDEAVARLPAAAPDVVLLDTMDAPGDPGLLAAIRAAVPHARVIVYSGYVSILERDELAAGADAYLAKGDDETALVSAIRAVAAPR